MRRTQLYLTEEQRRRLKRKADDAGASEAEVVRRILDVALGIDDSGAERVAAIDATAGILADAPDWPEWLERVRGRGAAQRLEELGL
jgi:hypothetical protein